MSDNFENDTKNDVGNDASVSGEKYTSYTKYNSSDFSDTAVDNDDPVVDDTQDVVDTVDTPDDEVEEESYGVKETVVQDDNTGNTTVNGLERVSSYVSPEEELSRYPSEVDAEFSLGKALSAGWKYTWKNPVMWFVIVPVVLFILALAGGVVGISSSLVFGSMASGSGSGLESGNPFPFIGLCLVLVLMSTLLSALYLTLVSNASVESLYKGNMTVSEAISTEGKFSSVYAKVLTVCFITMIFLVPLGIYSSGMSLIGNDSAASMVNFVTWAFCVLVAPYLNYVVLSILFKDKISVNQGIPFQQTWSIIKSKYVQIIIYEFVFGLITMLGIMVFFIGVFVAIPVVAIARAYLYKSLIEDDKNRLMNREIQEV